MKRAAALTLVFAFSAFGYVRQNSCLEQASCADNPPVPLVRVDNAHIQFYLNSQIVPGLQSSASGSSVTVISAASDPQGAAAAAAATWNAVTTANVNFVGIQSTTVGQAPDGMNVILLATTSNEISMVGGALAVTVTSWAPSPANLVSGGLVACSSNCQYPNDGDIFDSDILLNPAMKFSTDGTTGDDLQTVLTHEMGHALSANHTQELGATMFPYASLVQRLLSSDDIAFVTAAYPASGAPTLGTISGKVTLAEGTASAYTLLSFIDTAHGNSLGALTAADGTYSIQAPPGTYIMYAEPYNSAFQPANLYLVSSQSSLIQTIQPAFFGGSIITPTPISVIAGGTAIASLDVSTGPAPLGFPFYGIGGANKSGDVGTVNSINGPIEVASGQMFDFAFTGAGLDASTTVAVYGPGITASPVRVDPTVNFGGQPLLRTTLTIAARTSPALATLIVTRGASSIEMSGVLVIGPVQPTFNITGILNDNNDPKTAGQVAPGEIVSIYGGSFGPSCTYPNCPGYSFSSTFILNKDQTNTRVLFDGIPAPLLYSAAGSSFSQVNAIVPYEVAGKTSTKVQVEYEGISSATLTVPVVATSPGILAVQNANTPLGNTSATPVARGGYLTVWMTGEGQTNPAGVDGLGAAGFGSTYPVPVAPISVTIGGTAVPPGQIFAVEQDVSGLMQMNVQVPNLSTTGQQSMVVTIGGASAATVNVYVQ